MDTGGDCTFHDVKGTNLFSKKSENKTEVLTKYGKCRVLSLTLQLDVSRRPELIQGDFFDCALGIGV